MKNKKELNTEELNEVISLGKKILKVTYFVVIVGILLASTILIKELGILTSFLGVLKVLSPFFIGFVIAWLFNPVVKKLNENGIPKIAATLMIYAILLTVIFLFIRVLVPTIYSQLNDLIANIPNIVNKITEVITNVTTQFSIEGINLNDLKDNFITTAQTSIVGFTNSLPTTVINIVMALFSGIGTIALGLIIGLYMLMDFDKTFSVMIKLIPLKHRFEVQSLINNIGDEVRKTVNGTLLVALMVFVCDTIGFSIIGLDASLLFGLFCGITDLIPFIGPYIGGIPAVIVGFSQGTFVGFAALIIVVIVQCLENYVLQPIVMSKATKLHPVTIIVGLLIFGYFFGIVGMILASPLLAIGKVILSYVTKKFNKNKNKKVVELDTN